MSKVAVHLDGRTHLAVGLMSGTSHDGVSATLVRIDERKSPPTTLVAFRTYPYPPKFRARLLAASSDSQGQSQHQNQAPSHSASWAGAGGISTLNFELGRIFGTAALRVTRAAHVPIRRLSFIGSHGHTFFHQPRRAGRATASTLQLAEPAVIAAMTGAPVVADFRPMDVAVGGEGAPLAPLAHLWLFGHQRLGRVVQNIGGIGNATYLPPAARTGDRRLIAFDTGPGGMLIDALVARLTSGRLGMDRDGTMAARGRVDGAMLAELMRNPYFRRKPPKSTGREEFGAHYLDAILLGARDRAMSSDDLIASVTALTARAIGDACRRFIAPLGRVDQLIASGGGAHNPTLMKMIAAELPGIEVMTSGQVGVDGGALEAIAFAILAYQMLRGLPGNIPSVTGARSPAILGKLTLPPAPR
ncbi:MAG TPA: anhydro-N-acetylmuramic acid kinase [Candidatus Binataceae bacterium]|jgi:anhydro-N-acetylmuramic acid kinase|nr:anhydro-N-acetylmuramic acid kinase [Candidatus Binataceae bacterium]